MIEYIYIVKCPGCEDEMFNFFTDARMQCDLLMSKHPIITQVEVERNDFGECTNHCDLGTVWSWEEAMKDTEGGYTEAEPAKSVFTKDDLKPWIEDEDPEFDNLDNSVDCEIDKPVIEEDVKSDLLKYIAHIPKNVKPPHPVAKNGKCGGCGADLPAPNINGISKCTFCQGLYAGETFICCPSCGSPKIDPVQDFKCKSCGTTLSDLERGTCTKCGGALDSKLKCKSCGTVNKPSNTNISNNASAVRKPIPEGMTIEQLVEEMEENEDTVECTWCNDLFDKSECRKEVDLGWLCGRCEAAIKSRGETLTFRENNYWDFLDEDLEDTRDFADLVKDSINHLVNDIGRDSTADDFADDVIADLENNYDINVPEDPEKYRNWASAVAGEVSRQLNNQLDEDLKVDELHDIGNTYDGGYSDETSEVSDSHLKLCPECGKETFDIETGICVDCGFN